MKMGAVVVALAAASVGMAASIPNATGVPTKLVVTVRPARRGSPPVSLDAGDLRVLQGRTPAPVVGLQRLAGDLADMQLFILLDDSSRSSSLGVHLPELKTFLESLPDTTQV